MKVVPLMQVGIDSFAAAFDDSSLAARPQDEVRKARC
jgi:hypothetical protein